MRARHARRRLRCNIVDRRLQSPAARASRNRQRFLRRAKALVSRRCAKLAEPRHQGLLARAARSRSRRRRAASRVCAARQGGMRDTCCPATRSTSKATASRGRQGGGGRPAEASDTATARTSSASSLSRDEFLDLFLEDLELPDLAKRRLTSTRGAGLRRAGYSTSGSPAELSRRRAPCATPVAPHRAAAAEAADDRGSCEAEIARWSAKARRRRAAELRAELERAASASKRIPYIDPIDVRYRRFEPTPKPVAQAVMFCLMDVSGSMTEHMKDLAKRFYMLLYIFLKRRYQHVDVVFIRHTHQAEEVDEETFFHSPRDRRHGGVDRARGDAARSSRERYPPGRLEHLRRAGVRRRQHAARQRRDRAAADAT